MIYIAMTTRNHARSIGLVLWKLRRVFAEFPREYHVLVADDGSTDDTWEALEAYQGAVPLSLVRHEGTVGLAQCTEDLLREALARSDRPRRDCVITLPADFSASPAVVPELVRRFESGADLVVGESAMRDHPIGARLVRKTARFLLRPGVSIPGISDPVSGVCAIRLITLSNSFRDHTDRLLTTAGWCAHAELLARTALRARQIAVLTLPPRPSGVAHDPAPSAVSLALSLVRAGRRLRIPPPAAPVQRT